MTRAQFLRTCAQLAVAGMLSNSGLAASRTATAMATRPIPSTGEPLPVVGCGTYRGFDYAPGSDEYARLGRVVYALLEAGGKVIDTAAIYGRAERSVGEVLQEGNLRRQIFLASKVWSTGREAGVQQMERSLKDLMTDKLDLMQVHNLIDVKTQLATLHDWKANGRTRYIGITHYDTSAHDEVEKVLRSVPVDFLQINYSAEEPDAAKRLLPLAADLGVAVIINRPFGGGGLMRRLRDKPIPVWAGEIGCGSWAQILIKFVLSQSAVNCVIPGTGKPEHMMDNAIAGQGPFPDPSFWTKRATIIA
ncbi:aldo/keto reductase [Candidimonas sp. SYP-B2681]|uniref:aldo/keto reductase n=1 Tax=Candidimonas sp. SYP-B2681 TaxID=2497686 RepID=UPI000F87227F|nr:aldo/keto reductase [Candidimonas sp. SYP-B2681]RTZ48291.1 aldo/keto reductase [Candidimonas sp. SYP-B2681]